MLHHICDGGHSKLMEVDQLVLWVHYHDILGKFASKHWKTKSAENASMFQVPGMASSLVSSIANDQVRFESLLIAHWCVLIKFLGIGNIWMLTRNDQFDFQNDEHTID
jgi:hypothetical protein